MSSVRLFPPTNLSLSLPVPVIVLANNKSHGYFPASIDNMMRFNEIVLLDNGLKSCLPLEIETLKNLTIFDINFNELVGPLPDTIRGMVSLK